MDRNCFSEFFSAGRCDENECLCGTGRINRNGRNHRVFNRRGTVGYGFWNGRWQIELDPYDQVSDFGFSDSEALQSPIASFYSLCLYLSIGGMVLSLIIAGIKLAANDTGHGKHQFLDVVGAKVIVFFSISCLVGLINLFLGMLQH